MVNRQKKLLGTLLCLTVLVGGSLAWGNLTLSVSTYEVASNKLPSSFDGFKIAQVSDLHNTHLTSVSAAVLRSLQAEQPDLIVLTGDSIDCRKTDTQEALRQIAAFTRIAPCYACLGNHEINYSLSDSDGFAAFLDGLEKLGVTVLRNEKAEITRGGNAITICGLEDFYAPEAEAYTTTETAELFCAATGKGEGFSLLLAHQPQELPVYDDYGYDLVFSGHAHGGQARLFGQGLIAPDQGFFPKYTAGKHVAGGTAMIISRGVGNSIIPVRVLDRPELVYCTLHTAE